MVNGEEINENRTISIPQLFSLNKKWNKKWIKAKHYNSEFMMKLLTKSHVLWETLE